MSRRVLVALGLALGLLLFVSLGPAGFAAGAVTAFLPVPVYITLALWLDRNEPEPRALLARAFLWGMLVASLVSIGINALAVAYMQITLGLSAVVGQRLGVLLASPLVEEIAKGAALFLLFKRNRDEFDNVVDGAIYACMIGLGFAATENVLYYGNAAMHGRLAAVFAMRGVAAPFAHPLFTAMTGIGFGVARDQATRRARVLRIAAGLAAAVTLHAIWNLAAETHVLRGAYAIIMAPTLAGVLLLLRYSLGRERAILHERLTSECTHVPMTAKDVEALCAHVGFVSWMRRTFGSGRAAARAARDARRAGVELAFACWHAQCATRPEDGRIEVLRAKYVSACTTWRAQQPDHSRRETL